MPSDDIYISRVLGPGAGIGFGSGNSGTSPGSDPNRSIPARAGKPLENLLANHIRYAGSIPARAGKTLRVDEFQKTYITNTQNVTMIIAANITIESLIVQPPFFS